MPKLGKNKESEVNKESGQDINQEVKQDLQPEITDEILDSMTAALVDSAEKENFNTREINEFKEVDGESTIESVQAAQAEDINKGPTFPDPPESVQEKERPISMSVHSDEFYENLAGGFVPATEQISVGRNQEKKKASKVSSKIAAPATEIDLEKLDESMIMHMDEIKAAPFKIIDILNPKPKDKALRFRWVNYKNYVAGNLGKYLAIGYQPALLEDVDQNRTPIDASMVDGTQIKYYDVLLMKINVIRLMELYKTNIIKSVNKLQKTKEAGLAEANMQFRQGISSTPGASARYNQYKNALGREPVEFFAVD